MNKHSKLLGALVVVASAGSAHAATTNFQGSDTVKVITQNMIKLCTTIPVDDAVLGTRTITYIGGGSTTGENAMKAGTQFISPMSRPLRDVPPQTAPDLCADPDSELGTTTNHQLEVARDAMVVVTKASNIAGGAACENFRQETAPVALTVNDLNGVAGIQAPGISGATYTMTDWRDALKLAYFGIHHDAASTQDCNSDVRWTLLSDFRNLSDDGASCTGASCGAVTHLWRRDDVSGTTDTFKSLLGVSSSANFCNGNTSGVFAGDEKDNDPIRRPCQGTPTQAGSDQVCGSDGKLGVVQAITVPAGYSVAQIYNQPVCGTVRALAQVGDTTTGPADKCLAGMKDRNGTLIEYPAISQKCVVPVSAAGAFGCRWQSTPIPLTPSSADARVWNREARDPATGNLLLNADNNRPVLNAVYRVRPECTFLDATEQIGCLANVYGCSAGYAGFEATQIAGTAPVAFRIDGDAATEANVHVNVDDPTHVAGYRFSRKLYINSIIDTNAETAVSGWEGGFSDLTTLASNPAASQFVKDQDALIQCFKTPALLNQAINGGTSVTVGNVTSTLPRAGFFPPVTSVAPHVDAHYTAANVSCDLD